MFLFSCVAMSAEITESEDGTTYDIDMFAPGGRWDPQPDVMGLIIFDESYDRKPIAFEKGSVLTEKRDPVSMEKWAKALQDCVSSGISAAKKYAKRKKQKGKSVPNSCNYCAYGTRHAIMCAMEKVGMPRTKEVHCGAGAYAYHSECFEGFGFKKDQNKCNTPGVIRVYYGPDGKVRPKECGLVGGGRNCGHFEFLGTDKRYHSACSTAVPANERTGNMRRRLKACYVPK